MAVAPAWDAELKRWRASEGMMSGWGCILRGLGSDGMVAAALAGDMLVRSEMSGSKVVGEVVGAVGREVAGPGVGREVAGGASLGACCTGNSGTGPPLP